MAKPDRIYKIHPAIGIARVGDADRSDANNDFYFIGPEHPDVPVNTDKPGRPSSFKIAGKIRPQAARFRIFEYEKRDNGKYYPVGEVRADDASRKVGITWRVELANRKAFFCEFQGQAGAAERPLFSKSYSTAPNEKKGIFAIRNARVRGRMNREDALCLKPDPQEISGGDTASVKHFAVTKPIEVAKAIPTLGELRSDREGYLKIIGGYGNATYIGKKQVKDQLVNFANNDDWFDSVSDGPVDAKLAIDGKSVDVEGAWVIVGPPDFAPAVPSYRSMFDTLVDIIVREMDIPPEDGLFAEKGPLEYIAKKRAAWLNKEFDTLKLTTFVPEFTRDIAPILSSVAKMWRVTAYRFVEEDQDGNPRDKTTQGGPFAGDFHPSLFGVSLNQLGAAGSSEALRMAVFNRIRDPNKNDDFKKNQLALKEMPSTYGDYYQAVNGRPEKGPEYLHSVSRLQYALLKAWAHGKFKEDWDARVSSSEVTAESLDRAALASMSGGAFYPGMEAGWLFARREVFSAPFRVRRKPELDKSGKSVVLGLIPIPGETKPMALEFGAGLFTQQMAVPWQADFRECEAGFESDPSIPGKRQMRRIAWWPANRPDDVFPEDAPKVRKPWARLLETKDDPTSEAEFSPADDKDPDAHFRDMVELWSTLGFVVEMKPDGSLTSDLFEIDANPSFPPHRAKGVAGDGAVVADAGKKPADA